MSTNFDGNADFAGSFKQDFEKLKKETQKVSILVVGGTGTGKSTLVNIVFKRKIAEAGAGRPITKGINGYENDYLHIYDSEGYESGSANQERYAKIVEDFLKKQNNNVRTAIHLCWYCVSAPSARFTDCDSKFIIGMPKEIPLAIVLTKIDVATEEQVEALKASIGESCPNTPVFLSTDKEIPHDLDALDRWSRKQLPEALRRAFISVSNRDIDAKENEGNTIVLSHAGGAFATGFTPIPFSDAPILLTNQTVMLCRICLLWDMESLTKTLEASSSLSTVMGMIGKTIAGNILKWIPGIGTIAGGMINGTVAAGLTYALGIAVNRLCCKITKDRLKGVEYPLEQYLTPEFFNTLEPLFKMYGQNNKDEA
ncbi:MAG: GTPase [Desulfovibrio sp.]|uniref:YcjF family protein n=1 Tax=Desulfovibrio sp. TaxID=885 RepID=UPI002A36CCEC|nr:GTPase [Desulfovibrio sp.]MDY0260128.1 GTPase [Desulfovibrio sp.]